MATETPRIFPAPRVLGTCVSLPVINVATGGIYGSVLLRIPLQSITDHRRCFLISCPRCDSVPGFWPRQVEKDSMDVTGTSLSEGRDRIQVKWCTSSSDELSHAGRRSVSASSLPTLASATVTFSATPSQLAPGIIKPKAISPPLRRQSRPHTTSSPSATSARLMQQRIKQDSASANSSPRSDWFDATP